MNEHELKQFKIQVSKLVSKLQYLSSIVNLFTEGYAEVDFSKNFYVIHYRFAKCKRDWDTRYTDVTGEYIEENMYLRLSDGDDKQEWQIEDRKRIIPKLKAAIKSLENFIDNPHDYSFEKEFYWYTETIKYKVYELDWVK